MAEEAANPWKVSALFGTACILPPILTWMAATFSENFTIAAVLLYPAGASIFVAAFQGLQTRLLAGFVYLVLMAPVLLFIVLERACTLYGGCP
jgi:hypothetical protein